MIKLPPLGQPLHKVEKLADEIITYAFDLSETLEKNEVVTSVSCSLPCRSRKGKSIEVTSTSDFITGASSFQDRTIKVVYKTNFNNTRSFSFIIRIHR